MRRGIDGGQGGKEMEPEIERHKEPEGLSVCQLQLGGNLSSSARQIDWLIRCVAVKSS